MGLFANDCDRHLADTFARLVYVNPFSPERVECERELLGAAFEGRGAVWAASADDLQEPRATPQRGNIRALARISNELAGSVRARLSSGVSASTQELEAYEGLAIYALFGSHDRDAYWPVADEEQCRKRFANYPDFSLAHERLLQIPGLELPSRLTAEHTFAMFYQIHRAFHYIFRYILGSSLVVARLRADVWNSIFTHDLQRYHRHLYKRMHDIPTLITGPSGTGKELVAQAIGYAQYIPFDPRTQTFVQGFGDSYYPLSLSAMSVSLVESELFGHRRGSFTGAFENRTGWLEASSAHGVVFLDEIGELDKVIQVKLLRVLQSRTFQRVGDTETRSFQGKIVAATNRNLAAEMEKNRFRADFYYRLCADQVVTPSLEERVRSDSTELETLVLLLARRVAGQEPAEALAAEVNRWIDERLGADYPWPGNVRELEQCVRNVMIRRAYYPPRRLGSGGVDQFKRLTDEMSEGKLTADELVSRYVTLTYARTQSYVETGRLLEVDRRTVKAKVDKDLLERMKGG